MAGMAIYAGSLPTLMLPLIGGSYEGLRPILGEVLQQFCQAMDAP